MPEEEEDEEEEGEVFVRRAAIASPRRSVASVSEWKGDTFKRDSRAADSRDVAEEAPRGVRVLGGGSQAPGYKLEAPVGDVAAEGVTTTAAEDEAEAGVEVGSFAMLSAARAGPRL